MAISVYLLTYLLVTNYFFKYHSTLILEPHNFISNFFIYIYLYVGLNIQISLGDTIFSTELFEPPVTFILFFLQILNYSSETQIEA